MNSKSPSKGLAIIIDWLKRNGRTAWSTTTVIVPVVGILMGSWLVVLAGVSIIAFTVVGYWAVDMQGRMETHKHTWAYEDSSGNPGTEENSTIRRCGCGASEWRWPAEKKCPKEVSM